MGYAVSSKIRVAARIGAIIVMASFASPAAASAIHHSENDGDSYGIEREVSMGSEAGSLVILSNSSFMNSDDDPPRLTLTELPGGELPFALTNDPGREPVVSEPASLFLLGTALVMLGIASRRRRKETLAH